MEEGLGLGRSSPNLLCREEDESCLEFQNHCQDELSGFCSVSESDSEYIETLFEKEAVFQSNRNKASTDGSWLKCARVDAIRWILHTRAFFGFHFSTVYLSLIYFDRFFSKRSMDTGKIWAIRLLSVACLSLAAKMEECETPALSQYQIDEYSFEGRVIQRMELLVLNTLEWKMMYPTPFVYLNYFIIKFCAEFKAEEVINRAVELILSAIEDINVLDHRPSVLAAAAILAANDRRLTSKTLEVKINAVPLWGSSEKDHTFICYNMFQETRMLKSRVAQMATLDNSTITSNKRRLTSSNIDSEHQHPKTRKS